MTVTALFAKASVPALVSALALAFAGSAQADYSQGFDTAVPAGWSTQNNSDPIGTTNWFQGNTTVFSAHSGAANSYVAANFNNTAGAGTISNWLILPTMSFNNGDTVSFYTRTVDTPAFADRLELRFSSVGGSFVGDSAADVGTFTTLLLSVNPDLDASNYPNEWTQYSATLSGLAGATNGTLAFRYFVEDGGPIGSNSDYMGIDTLQITAAVPEPGTYALMALGLGALALRRKQKHV